MAYFIPITVAIVLRFIIGVIPLSILALISVISGCSTTHMTDQAGNYSIPPQQTQPLLDYREFGIPAEWDPVGILLGQAKVRSQLMADMRLLMQLGVNSEIYKVQNQYQAVEYWLIAVDFQGREQARLALIELDKTGMWSRAVSLVAMPGNDPAEQVAARTP